MPNSDTVYFLMPDGTKVSNDPRFDQDEAREKALSAEEYSGDAGIHHEDQKAQTQVEHMASMQSGQPGVGENAAPEDPTKDLHGTLGSPAQRIQKEDAKQAAELGGTPKETADEDPEEVDSNEAVKEARKARLEAAKAALEENEESEGDPDKPYSEWSAKQLKHEVAKRNAEEDRAEEHNLVLKGKKKPDVAAMLDEDDARRGSGS